MADQITIDRAVVQQALEALNRGLFKGELIQLRERAASGLEAALAQAETLQRKPLTDAEIEIIHSAVGNS